MGQWKKNEREVKEIVKEKEEDEIIWVSSITSTCKICEDTHKRLMISKYQCMVKWFMHFFSPSIH